MEARRTFGGASGSKQLGIVLVAIIAAALLAVAGAMFAKSLNVGTGSAAPTVKTYVDAPKDFPDRQSHVVVNKPDAPGTWHARPGMI